MFVYQGTDIRNISGPLLFHGRKERVVRTVRREKFALQHSTLLELA